VVALPDQRVVAVLALEPVAAVGAGEEDILLAGADQVVVAGAAAGVRLEFAREVARELDGVVAGIAVREHEVKRRVVLLRVDVDALLDLGVLARVLARRVVRDRQCRDVDLADVARRQEHNGCQNPSLHDEPPVQRPCPRSHGEGSPT